MEKIMETVANQKFIHISPRKLRLMADAIRKMDPNKALETLRFSQKSAAKPLTHAIKAVIANAKQKGMKNISFKKIEINEGPKMRRFRAGSRGRVKPYKRKMSHIRIVLSDELIVRSKTTRKEEDETKARGGRSGNVTKSTQSGKPGSSKP